MDITAPPDFPKADYLEVEQRLSTYLEGLHVDAGTVPGFRGYAGGWNAVILRFRAADEDSSAAAISLARFQGGLSNEERYEQERPLFGFFVNAQSAIESCCFGIYHIACMRNPTAFSRTEYAITPDSASSDFAATYPGSGIASELDRLTSDATWNRIKDIRRILFHRMHPGITIYIGTVGAAPPPPAEWTDRGVVLEPALVNNPRDWLASEVSLLVAATLDFVKAQF